MSTQCLPGEPPSRGSEPVRRQPSDQGADFAEVVKNLLSEAYADWPNDTGFDGLREERGPILIPVNGHIPAWAAGSLYRTGPGQYEISASDSSASIYKTDHWFDGLAHTHRFDIIANPKDNGAVTVQYTSRRQSEELMRQIQASGGRRTRVSFAQRVDPCLGLFGKFMTAFRAHRASLAEQAAENICVSVQANPPGYRSAEGNLTDGSWMEGKTASAVMATHNTAATETGGSGHRSGRTIWITSDTSSYKQVDATTLEPIGFATQAVLHPDLDGPLSCAHAQRCPSTGDLFNFNQSFGPSGVKYRVFRVSAATGETNILATISGSRAAPAYIHSLFLSEHFVLVCIPSSHLMWGGVRAVWERNLLSAIKPFDAADASRWFVVDRGGRGVVAQFATAAGFFFHSVNAFEERDEEDVAGGTVSLFCDGVRYANNDILSAYYMDVIMQRGKSARSHWDTAERIRGSNPALVRHRVRVPFSFSNTAQNRSLDIEPEIIASIPGPHVGELPTMNPAYATRRQRYVYSLPSRGLSTIADALAKTDIETGEVIFWNNPHGHTPGEAIFVPRPGGVDEDDGVLMSVVLDGTQAKSYLLVLDARTMKEMGRADVGFAIGLGFHGLHLPG